MKISNGQWGHGNFLKQKLAELGKASTMEDLERVIGAISYARHCVKGVEMILGPLREGLRTFKVGEVTEDWLRMLNEQAKESLEKAIVNVHWLVLPGGNSDRFAFVIEFDWSSKHAGFILFASRNGEEKILDMGSRRQKMVSSSYLGELDALVWACKRTKAFRGAMLVVVRTNSCALVEKWKSHSLYDSDIRIFRRLSSLVANESELTMELTPRSENTGAGLLSRPIEAGSNRDSSGPSPVEHQVSVWNEIWDEHLKGNWGVFRNLHALKKKGSSATREMVKKVCDLCEVCEQFRNRRARAPYRQPFFPLGLGHTVFGDVIGPLPRGKGGAMYIHCMVDSATCLGDAMQLRDTSTVSILKAFQYWIRKNGLFKVLVTDNAAYYASEEMAILCKDNEVDHKYIAPYRHQSVGLVERYHQTLIDRIQKLKFLGRG